MSKKFDIMSGKSDMIPPQRPRSDIDEGGVEEYGKIIWWGNRRKEGLQSVSEGC